MQPNGVIAFHVTNRYLDLPPVVQKIADAHGVPAVLISHDPDEKDERYSRTDWVLISRDKSVSRKRRDHTLSRRRHLCDGSIGVAEMASRRVAADRNCATASSGPALHAHILRAGGTVYEWLSLQEPDPLHSSAAHSRSPGEVG